ncbi:MAG: 3-dehydroquinate synthase, partial [Treponema sp.]|nr:3-dehydroquinate synthase [Treponema sp.]
MESFESNINYPTGAKTKITYSSNKADLVSLFKVGEQNARRFFITDATVASLPSMQSFTSLFTDDVCGNDSILVLGSGEPYKTVESVLSIVKSALVAGFTRDDSFVAIGGGVILDIVGFAASIFKRGISLEFVPTTLLSMVDASIGGKTGVDFENYKNMIGTFFPAKKIHIFQDFINSLPENQYLSGLAEAFKTAILYNEELAEIFKNESEKILARDPYILQKIIIECVKEKSRVVENDFFEKIDRVFLNLGHTFAHALESVAGFGNITHGSAVAWGIGRATDLSNKLDICNSTYKENILNMLKLYNWETSATPKILGTIASNERLVNAMKADKKNKGNNIRF